MRDIPSMWELWQGAKGNNFVGDYAFVTRVTVEKDYWLRKTNTISIGKWKRGPARWWQRAEKNPDNLGQVIHSGITDELGEVVSGQVETEIPNISSVNWSRSVDQDVGAADIVILNRKEQAFGDPDGPDGEFGIGGWYTPGHGSSQEAKARWGHAPNEWAGVLGENALIRIYQGFGGQDKTIEQAVEDGNLLLVMTCLVDKPTETTDGTLHLSCRDMGKLAADQQLWEDLIPRPLYPLEYCRYTYKQFQIPPEPKPPAGDVRITQPTFHYDNSGNHYYADGAAVAHPGTEAFDWSFNDPPNAGPGQIGHQRTYWLSEPKDSRSPDFPPWIEFTCGNTPVNCVYFHPYAGNYTMDISVFENGHWVGPEDEHGGFAAGLPYISRQATNWEGGNPPGSAPNIYYLPRTYRAERIRLTFRNLAAVPEGGYRAGARKIVALLDLKAAEYPSRVLCGASIPFNGEGRAGYWQARSTGQVYAFGDARVYHDSSNHRGSHIFPVTDMAAAPDGLGYWTLDYSGLVRSWGSAHHEGDDGGTAYDAVGVASTPSGNGYWILHNDGTVNAFGDASDLGDSSHSGSLPYGTGAHARSIAAHPTSQGYWVLWTDGTVTAHGTATHHGNANRAGFVEHEYVARIRHTHDGAGYWIISGGGRVQAFGNAVDLGDAPGYPPEQWALGLTWDILPYSLSDDGYAIQHADGNLATFGTFESFGSIGSGGGQERSDGSYKDYSDIIRELALWSGFLLKKFPQIGDARPPVYGNIESTGAFSKECLPKDLFDKKPVAEAMRSVKEIVGYILYYDAEGAIRFESPNWWTQGNYLIDGTPFDFMPQIDERVNLLQLSSTSSDQDTRSKIVISNEEIPAQTSEAIVTTLIPADAGKLKGMVKPAAWSNGVFTNKDEQKVMADLIAMHIWFAARQNTTTIVPNPLLDIDDQVRIFERQSGETFVHYIRSISCTHDISNGNADMELQTNWLGGNPYGQVPLFFSCATKPAGGGYWQVDVAGDVWAFGGASLYRSNVQDSHTEWVVCIRSSATGNGYYTLDRTGKMLTYGDAVHHGDIRRPEVDILDMAITPSGEGYWLLRGDGTVYPFGDAVDHGSSVYPDPGANHPGGHVAHSIESHPDDDGYWVLWSDGHVTAHGDLVHHGNANRVGFQPTEYVASLRRTASGDGYYITSGSGIVQVFGDAVFHGNGELSYPLDQWPFALVWSMIPNYSSGHDGYMLQHADGALEPIGDSEFVGAVGGIKKNRNVNDGWAIITRPTWENLPQYQRTRTTPVSDEVVKFLGRTGSKSAANAVASNFGSKPPVTSKVPT